MARRPPFGQHSWPYQHYQQQQNPYQQPNPYYQQQQHYQEQQRQHAPWLPVYYNPYYYYHHQAPPPPPFRPVIPVGPVWNYGQPPPMYQPPPPPMNAWMTMTARRGDRSEDLSDVNARRLEQADHLRPPVYQQPKWMMGGGWGPPRPTKSDDRTKSGKPVAEPHGRVKNCGLRLAKEPYFIGFVSPTSMTVADMENIPDLACSIWEGDSSIEDNGCSSSPNYKTPVSSRVFSSPKAKTTASAITTTPNAFDRDCTHFKEIRQKSRNRTMEKIWSR